MMAGPNGKAVDFIEDGKDGKGLTALHCAALGGRVETVLWLLERGADATRRDASGRTALHMMAGNTDAEGATGERFLPAITALLDKGADVEARDSSQVGWR
jgi:ankyrin repeat protein